MVPFPLEAVQALKENPVNGKRAEELRLLLLASISLLQPFRHRASGGRPYDKALTKSPNNVLHLTRIHNQDILLSQAQISTRTRSYLVKFPFVEIARHNVMAKMDSPEGLGHPALFLLFVWKVLGFVR